MSEEQQGLNIPVDKVIAAYQRKIGELTHLVIMYEGHIEQLTEQLKEAQAQETTAKKSSASS